MKQAAKLSSQASRETFSSRFGFLMLSAACAIGLGNVWRFPYITGKYGGGMFVLVYLFFLLAVLPIMIAEFAIGRASRSTMGKGFALLAPPKSRWRYLGFWSLLGSYALLMFYCTVSGWMLAYTLSMATGSFTAMTSQDIATFFTTMLKNPAEQVVYTTLCIALCASVTAAGLRRGVERVIKILMVGLFLLLSVLVVRALFLPNALSGVSYFLLPDIERFTSQNFLEICNAAMCQAFFTLGIGIGSMATIGSYYAKEKSLAGEAVWIASLDTIVALMAGLLIFPACFAFAINPDSGPGLLFITLPNVFVNMPDGRIWGTLFFLFMTFASFSTVIAVFETCIAYSHDLGYSRTKASLLHGGILWFLSHPCALGWSLLSDFHPFGPDSSVLDLEDFIVSCNILPIGALICTLFCSLSCGWGWENFRREVNQGAGVPLPAWFGLYLRWILPIVLVGILVAGYIERFFH